MPTETANIKTDDKVEELALDVARKYVACEKASVAAQSDDLPEVRAYTRAIDEYKGAQENLLEYLRHLNSELFPSLKKSGGHLEWLTARRNGNGILKEFLNERVKEIALQNQLPVPEAGYYQIGNQLSAAG